MRLIDADALKKEIYTMTEWNGDVHRIIYEQNIDDAPTIEERPKGKWVEYYIDGEFAGIKCSNCQTLKTYYCKTKFCHECGADMRGGK